MEFTQNQNSSNKLLLDQEKKVKRLKLHSFHRYYGKLIPAIPRTFIKKFTKEGDLIFDPFSGSGTTALESLFTNRNFVGVEVNPLSVLISRAKTNVYDYDVLNKLYSFIEVELSKDIKVDYTEIPFVINRDHWFKDEVQKDLIRIEKTIIKALELDIVKHTKESYADFLYGTLSAIIKNVSNADTQHVFPGVSKRMRRLEAEGKNIKNAFATYLRALKRRINDTKETARMLSEVKIIESDITKAKLKDYYGKVDLIVTNPPYISSVRYTETLKLELYWMRVITSQQEYANLSSKNIGNDKINKSEYEKKYHTKHDFINELIDAMYLVDKKNAKVIFDFFTLMDKVIFEMYNLLKPGSRVVMKISDSRIRKTKVETGRLLTLMAKKHGFKLEDLFDDKIDQNSRSLLTARNTYSGIILHDNIIIWRKPDGQSNS